jgi:hypothetical protein
MLMDVVGRIPMDAEAPLRVVVVRELVRVMMRELMRMVVMREKSWNLRQH